MSSYNKQKFKQFKELYFQLLTRKNKEDNSHYNGIIQRYLYPVITAKHIPLEWRYDLNPETNPWLMSECHHEFGSYQMERQILVGSTCGRERP